MNIMMGDWIYSNYGGQNMSTKSKLIMTGDPVYHEIATEKVSQN